MAVTGEPVAHSELVGSNVTALHKHTLDSNDPPTSAVDFNKQQATALVIENRITDPVTPASGQIWLRTDL